MRQLGSRLGRSLALPDERLNILFHQIRLIGKLSILVAWKKPAGYGIILHVGKGHRYYQMAVCFFRIPPLVNSKDMDDYQIQPNTRQCTITGRNLEPGEKFYSVVLEEQGKLVRRDYCEAAWQGLPSGIFGYWTGHVPEKEASRKLRRDDDLLLDCLVRLESATDAKQLNLRYVVALLLLRSKRLQFEDTRKENGLEFLRLRNRKTGDIFEVQNRPLSETEIEAVREEVFQVVGWE